MVKIISDTSTLYSIDEAKQRGFDVSPLSVTINDNTYEEFEDITTEEFIEIINQGHIPKSSQPSIGRVKDLYDSYPDDQILNITMADGLSGTYKSAELAKTMANNPENITVFNSKTLCGPHRTIVETAVDMAKNGSESQLFFI